MASTRKRRSRPRQRSGRPLWPAITLAALAVVTVAVAVIAYFSAIPRDEVEAGPGNYDAIGGGGGVTAPTDQPTAAAEPIPAQTRIIVALSGTGAWRSGVGSCPGDNVSLEYSTDSGSTWTRTGATDQLGISSILALTRGADSTVRAVGTPNEGCAPGLFQTSVRADRWAPGTGVEQQWYVVPGQAGTVNSPNGVLTTPCSAIIEVHAIDDQRAALLCNDQRIFRTLDGGANWLDGLYVPGARAFTVSPAGYLVATEGQEGCEGVELAIVYPQVAPRDGSAAGCRQTDADTSQMAISMAGETVWLWAGDQISVTVDGGATWN